MTEHFEKEDKKQFLSFPTLIPYIIGFLALICLLLASISISIIVIQNEFIKDTQGRLKRLEEKALIQGPPGLRGPQGLPGPIGLNGDKGIQ